MWPAYIDGEAEATQPNIVDIKPRPNHRLYISILRDMAPADRLRKAFELSSLSRELFRHGLRKRHPELDDPEFESLLKRRLAKCHNRNY